jgi:cytochrome d ubiquinol oxidase subunit II
LVQPNFAARFAAHPWGFVFPLLALLGLVGVRVANRGEEARPAFVSSSLYVIGILTSAAFGLYPYLLPSLGGPSGALTIYNSAAGHYGLTRALLWAVPGLMLAAAYLMFAYRISAGKTDLGSTPH